MEADIELEKDSTIIEDAFLDVKEKILKIFNTTKSILNLEKGTIITYYALFEYEEGYYNVYFPEIPAYTCGRDIEDAVYMAKDVLKCFKLKELPIPILSLDTFKEKYKNEYVKSLQPLNSLIPITVKIKDQI